MHQWEYCYIEHGRLYLCTPEGVQEKLIQECPSSEGRRKATSCVAARLGVERWEAFAAELASAKPVVWFKRQKQDEPVDASRTHDGS